jgi:hypothetical protein
MLLCERDQPKWEQEEDSGRRLGASDTRKQERLRGHRDTHIRWYWLVGTTGIDT